MKTLGFIILALFSSLCITAVAFVVIILMLPNVRDLEKCFTTQMFEVYLCPESRDYVKIENISPYVIHAVIAAEDGSFYNHQGFDWHELKQSFQANLQTGQYRRGGSTITQQLAKNAFLSADKSIWRKLKEAYLARVIEKRYDKNFILEKYLNVVEFGPGLYGIKKASLHYFSKSPSQLHPLEAAYLAHLLPNPKVYSRSFRKGELTAFSKRMIEIILSRMKSFKKLAPQAFETSVASLTEFPWRNFSLDSFQGRPTNDIEAEMPSDFGNEPQLEKPEDNVDTIVQDAAPVEVPAAEQIEPSDSTFE